jgi:predicted nucleotidyltransferase
MKPDNIILEAVTGSKAYGLDTENSDTDIKGIYVVPTEKVLRTGWNPDKTTKDHTEPDWVYHELQKFMKLAMNGNPTILELLFMEEYNILTPIGKKLVDNRDIFLSNVIFNSYGGYALSQARDLNRRGHYGNGRSNRKEKHTRHLVRLMWQGEQLLTTGKLTVRLTEQQRAECFRMQEKSSNEIVSWFDAQLNHFNSLKSVLPDKPDVDAIDRLLVEIRHENMR